MLYSYAHYVKKLGSGRCQGQSCLAATMLLAKKYDCCTAIVEMSATDQHMFVIAANRDTFRTGSEVANLSPHPIIDCWLVLKLRSVGTVVKSGVFAARNHAAYLQKLEYSTKLDSVQRFTSPFE